MRRSTPIPVISAILIVVALAGSLACDDSNTLFPSSSGTSLLTKPITLDEVFAAPITSLVGGRIAVTTRVLWENDLPVCVGDPDCPKDKYVASPLTVFFENGDDYIPEEFRGEHRGDMFIVSDAITSEFNEDNVEEYYFDGELLDRSVVYYLTGTFAYREWIGDGDPPIDNPDFIEQSNQVTYWRQTFEFHLESVRVGP